MKEIKCLLVDDEPLAREILERHIGDVPQLKLIGEARTASEALELIQEQEIQLIFLDINLPDFSGVKLARVLPPEISVIFTTAYPDFAVEGFELAALDYLVKPISFERFLKAVHRAIRETFELSSFRENDFMMVKEDKKLFKVQWESIDYIQGYGDYLKIFTNERVFIQKETIKQLLNKAPEQLFVRIHKSYICRISAIEYLEGNQVYINGDSLPIGATYKENLLKRLGA